MVIKSHEVRQVRQRCVGYTKVDDLAAFPQLCQHVLKEQALVQAIDFSPTR